MTEDKKYNPFQGLDGSSTPAELLKALMDKAIEDNDLRPVGGVVGMLQKQVEATMQHLGQVLQSLREEVGQTSMVTDVGRLTSALLINILIDKGIVTKDEFEVMYKEKVTDIMDGHMKKIQEEQEKAMAAEKEKIEEFAKKASEGEAVIDPATGEEVKLGIVENKSEDTEEDDGTTPEAPEEVSSDAEAAVDPPESTEQSTEETK